METPSHNTKPLENDLTDDLQSLSFTSTTTTITTLHRTSSSSSSTLPSTHSSFSSKPPHNLSFSDLRFSLRLGSGDIGSVYLAELKTNDHQHGNVLFAAKVMDKKELVSRSKEGRAKTEMEILEKLDHPFLPFLFSTIDSPRWLCFLTEFCPGGDLHVLRQRQPLKRFHETAVRKK